MTLEEAVEHIAKNPRQALGPWEVAGTDHSPDKLRCMLEGVRAGARAVQNLMVLGQVFPNAD